ncbi:MAG: type II secretion system protein N [Rhodanobacter sp.]|jgi:hypothetical protein|nr:type II secretion system protein N [Rhodanobacter sp.]
MKALLRIWKIVLVLLALVLAGVLFWTLPADVGYRHARQYLGPLTLTGIHGTVWDGHADGVSVFDYDLGEMDWHASKTSLLHGEFAADIRVKGANIDIAGGLVRGPGRVTARDLRFSVPAELLEPILEVGHANLYGTINGTLAHATLSEGTLSNVAGDARWSGEKNTGEKNSGRVEIPNLVANFSSQPDGSVAGTLRDETQGDLAADGTFTLRLESISGQIRFSARNDNAAAAETLRHLGKLQPDGSAVLNVHERTWETF